MMRMEDRKDNYEDIIAREHPISATHPRMSLQDRAAQFSPFAALTGFEDYLSDSERNTIETLSR